MTKDTDLHALLDFLVDSLGHPHEQNLWQSVDEDAPDPRRHFVRGRFAVVHVEDDDGDEDGQADEEHGEEEVLAEQRDGQRRGRDDLRDEEEEHGLRQEDADAKGHFLAGIGRQVEDQDGEAGNADAGNDQVDRVEERLASQRDVEEDIYTGKET